MSVTKYCFPDDLENAKYCVFPSELEGDELVFFHGTLAKNLHSILEDGFRIPATNDDTGLASVSFAKNSNTALNHVCTKRKSEPGTYCILAVRYECLKHDHLKVNNSDIHDYSLDPPPSVIGYCMVPSTYQHF